MNALFQPEHHITSPEAGMLALAASVVMQAIEDVRIGLTRPEFGRRGNRLSVMEAKSRAAKRATEARVAAQWLQGPECRELCDLLAECGYPVPLKRLFRELKTAKHQTQNREPQTEN